MIANVRRRAISGGKAGRFEAVSNMKTAIDWGSASRKVLGVVNHAGKVCVSHTTDHQAITETRLF